MLGGKEALDDVQVLLFSHPSKWQLPVKTRNLKIVCRVNHYYFLWC